MADVTPYTPESRPLESISLPKASARTALRDRLIEVFNLKPEYAAALARLPVDPTEVRKRIEHPLPKKFAAGTAYFLPAFVWAPLVVSSPVNPRETEDRKYPAAAKIGESVWPPIGVETVSPDQPVMKLVAETRSQMEDALRHSAEFLRDFNAELREQIRLDGILDPVTVCLAVVEHQDGTESIVVPISVDGSTRMTHSHDLTGFDPVEVVYRLPHASDREWRGRIGPIIQAQEKAEDEVTEAEADAHRALVVQALMLVKVEPVRGGDPVDVVAASRAIVAGIHVTPPKKWPEGSQMDEISDAVIERLVKDGKIQRSEGQFIKGLLHPDDLPRFDLPEHPDERAAFVTHTLYDERNRASVSAGYRGLVDKQRLGNRDRVKLATELSMRSFRNRYNRRDVNAIRSALDQALGMNELRANSWEVTCRSPEELLDSALAEFAANPDELGPDRLELGILGLYWLASTRALTREGRHDTNTQATSSILRGMLMCEHGLRQLYQAIVDGRSDPAADKPARAVDKRGNFVPRAGGGQKMLENGWLREQFGVSTDDEDREDAGENDDSSPVTRFQQMTRKAQGLVERLDAVMNEMRRLKTEEGRAVAMTRGVPGVQADMLREKLSKAALDFGTWAAIYRTQEVIEEEEVDLLEETAV